jgi:PAS domain S-box-containing protein
VAVTRPGSPDDSTLARLLVDQADDGLVFADREGVIRTWSAGAERIFGFPREEAVGQTLDLIVPERFREAHWAGFDRALEAGRTKYAGQVMPTRSARKDGTPIYVELSFTMIHDDAGAVLGVLAGARDITERFARERDERARLRALEEQAAGVSPPASPPPNG